MNHYLIMYVPPRADFAENATPEESTILERHLEYLKGKLADGSREVKGFLTAHIGAGESRD